MKTYVGGEIREEYREEQSALAVVINHPLSEPNNFGVFLYPVGSDEFTHLTGTNQIANPVDRVYIGVSHAAGDDIARQGDDLRRSIRTLDSIDRHLVYPVFLEVEPQLKPAKIILESTKEGYREVFA